MSDTYSLVDLEQLGRISANGEMILDPWGIPYLNQPKVWEAARKNEFVDDNSQKAEAHSHQRALRLQFARGQIVYKTDPNTVRSRIVKKFNTTAAMAKQVYDIALLMVRDGLNLDNMQVAAESLDYWRTDLQRQHMVVEKATKGFEEACNILDELHALISIIKETKPTNAEEKKQQANRVKELQTAIYKINGAIEHFRWVADHSEETARKIYDRIDALLGTHSPQTIEVKAEHNHRGQIEVQSAPLSRSEALEEMRNFLKDDPETLYELLVGLQTEMPDFNAQLKRLPIVVDLNKIEYVEVEPDDDE